MNSRQYKIRWPLGEAIAHLFLGLPTKWDRRAPGDEWWFCRGDAWLASLIWAVVIGGALGSCLGALCSTTGKAHDITLWNATGLHPAFWFYLVGAIPVLGCIAIEGAIAAGYVFRASRTVASLALPRIEKVPVDRELVKKYERGEL